MTLCRLYVEDSYHSNIENSSIRIYTMVSFMSKIDKTESSS